MWTGFLFFSDLFKVDTINAQNEPVATEPFCTSSIQCLLYFINYGIRSGGGVGDLLGTPSFKDDYWFFMKIFFYEILFHLIIVMIFANVFLGLIADAFGELREAAEVKSNDKENICFICQINSDDCANKGIDFEEHIMKKHNLWDYINHQNLNFLLHSLDNRTKTVFSYNEFIYKIKNIALIDQGKQKHIVNTAQLYYNDYLIELRNYVKAKNKPIENIISDSLKERYFITIEHFFSFCNSTISSSTSKINSS